MEESWWITYLHGGLLRTDIEVPALDPPTGNAHMFDRSCPHDWGLSRQIHLEKLSVQGELGLKKFLQNPLLVLEVVLLKDFSDNDGSLLWHIFSVMKLDDRLVYG